MDSSLLENVETIPPVKGRKGYAYSIIKKPGIRNTDILNAISIQGEILHFEEKLPSLNDIFLNYTPKSAFSGEKQFYAHLMLNVINVNYEAIKPNYKNEFLTDVRSKGFWISTIIVPLIIIAFGIIFGFILKDADSFNNVAKDLPDPTGSGRNDCRKGNRHDDGHVPYIFPHDIWRNDIQ